jgi:hypothetical protein
MADWFETRFREPVNPGRLDPAFVARMRALVVEEWQADAGTTQPEDTDPDDREDTDPDDREGDIILLETEDHPTGHEPATPRRPSPGRWLLVAAAVAVVAVVGTVLVAASRDDDETQVDTATSTPTPAPAPAQNIMDLPGFSDLEPGRYFVDPDGDDTTPLRVSYQVAHEGWSQWFGAIRFREAGHTALSITTVTNLVTEACTDHTPADPPVGPTVDDLATALSQFAPFEVTAPPTDVTLFGYPGKHLELTVPALPVTGVAGEREFADCIGGNLHSWIAPNSGGSFYGYTGEPGETEEFWILDVEGTRLVLVKHGSPTSPPQDVAERDAIFETIHIEP